MTKQLNLFQLLEIIFNKKFFIVLFTLLFSLICSPIVIYNKSYSGSFKMSENQISILKKLDNINLKYSGNDLVFVFKTSEEISDLIKRLRNNKYLFEDKFLMDIGIKPDEVIKYFDLSKSSFDNFLGIYQISLNTRDIKITEKLIPLYIKRIDEEVKKNLIKKIKNFEFKYIKYIKKTIKNDRINLEKKLDKKNLIQKKINHLKNFLKTTLAIEEELRKSPNKFKLSLNMYEITNRLYLINEELINLSDQKELLIKDINKLKKKLTASQSINLDNSLTNLSNDNYILKLDGMYFNLDRKKIIAKTILIFILSLFLSVFVVITQHHYKNATK